MGQGTKTRYTLAKKVELLDLYANGEDSQATIADNHGIPSATFANWSANEKAIRAAYAKELKQAAKQSNGSSVANGNGSTAHKSQPVEKVEEGPPVLKWLEDVVRRQVNARVDADLPAAVDKALAKLLAERSSAN